MLHVGTYIPETIKQKAIVVWLMVFLGELAGIDQHTILSWRFHEVQPQKIRNNAVGNKWTIATEIKKGMQYSKPV